VSPPVALSALGVQARLLQLASQALPTGSFAYSSGLEAAHARGLVTTEADGLCFLEGLMMASPPQLELPLLLRMYDALGAGRAEEAAHFSQVLLASRESREFQEQDGQMARALDRVLWAIAPAACNRDLPPRTFLEALARAAQHYGLAREDTALLGLYTWIEQHTTALARLLPLGPLASQRVVDALLGLVPSAIARALAVPDDDIGFGCPTLALLSAWHETQYSRLFRS
jgi:urease accessory protein